MADDLQTLFGIPRPEQLPWTDRNSPLIGGPGQTPQTGLSDLSPSVPQQIIGGGIGQQRLVRGYPFSSTGAGGQTPPDSEPAGRTPRIVSAIPNQPAYQHSDVIPIPTQSTGGGAYIPVASSTGPAATSGAAADSSFLNSMTQAQQTAYGYFTGLGWSPNFSQAMTASLSGESGRNLNTAPLQGGDAKNGGGNGIASWSKDRFQALGSPKTLQDQLSAVGQEVQNYPKIAGLTNSNSHPADLTNMITGGLQEGPHGTPSPGSYLTPQVANGYARYNDFASQTGLPTANRMASGSTGAGSMSNLTGAPTSPLATTPGAGIGQGGMSSQQFQQLMGAAQGGGGGPKVNLLGQLLFGNKGIMGLMPQSIQQKGLLGGLGGAGMGGGATPASTTPPATSPFISSSPVPNPSQSPTVLPIPALGGGTGALGRQGAPTSGTPGAPVAGTGGAASLPPPGTGAGLGGPVQQGSAPNGQPYTFQSQPALAPPANNAGAGTQGALTPGAGAPAGASPAQLSMLAQLFQGGGGAGLGAQAPAALASGGGLAGGGGLLGALGGLFA